MPTTVTYKEFKYTIPVLGSIQDGEEMAYLPWTYQMITIFKAAGCYDGIIQNPTAPNSNDEATWKSKNDEALQLLQLAVKNSDLTKVIMTQLASVAWENLRLTYNDSA
ncbi:hypothetical protein HK096_001506 [Nowakowskiella sp. JEL0078]|nr:hypothetical protein HK096_001506 [Nowakowskiella sp. JEL0078]